MPDQNDTTSVAFEVDEPSEEQTSTSPFGVDLPRIDGNGKIISSSHLFLSTALFRLCDLISEKGFIFDGRELDFLLSNFANTDAEEIGLRSLWFTPEKLNETYLSRYIIPGLVRFTKTRLEAVDEQAPPSAEIINARGSFFFSAAMRHLHAVEAAIAGNRSSSGHKISALIECRNSWLYVCACLGDRNSMVALSSGIDVLVAPAIDGRDDILRDRAVITAKSWRTLASFREAFPRGLGSPDIDPSIRDFATLKISFGSTDEIMEALTSCGLEASVSDQDLMFGWLHESALKSEPSDQPTHIILDNISDGSDGDTEAAIQSYGSLMRPLPLVGGEKSADTVFNELQAEFPWLEEANLWLAEAVAISKATGRGWFHSSPGLLLGNPGIGKSRWARRAADLAGVPFGTIPLSGAHTSVTISGVERGWKGGRPSAPATIIRDLATANPLLLLDEIDKVGSGSHNGNVIDALLPLLEVETASRFYDSYLLGHLNLSKTTFIMTANDRRFASPFLDRVRILNCEQPKKQHFECVARNILRDVANDLGFNAPTGPEAPDVTDLFPYFERVFVKSGSIRALRKVMEAGIRKRIWTPRNAAIH